MRKPIVIPTHARNAMMARRVTIDEVLDIMSHPDTTNKDKEGNTRFFLNNLCVVAKEQRDRYIIKTVLLRIGLVWTDLDARNR